ncbi:MAG TPA: hypothetical protein DD417_05080 [Elusimicrobia bacterium]|nr:hypothetical protein [Elusimicrobiota bacterium]
MNPDPLPPEPATVPPAAHVSQTIPANASPAATPAAAAPPGEVGIQAGEIIPGKTEEQARSWYFERLEHHKKFTETVHKLICGLLDDRRILIVDVIPRVKKLDSFLGKLKRKPDYRDFSDCEDICGCRIICVTSAQIDEVRLLIEEQFHPTEQFWHKPEDSGDNIKFGYRSYHMMVELNAARKALTENAQFLTAKCELQIRTAFQEAWSALDHKVAYKPEAKTDPNIRRAIQRIAALVELADKEWEEIYKKVWGGATND